LIAVATEEEGVETMATAKPQIVVCTYRVKPGNEKAFRRLLTRHWPTLKRLGLVMATPRLMLRGLAKENRSDFVELFAWKPRAFQSARTMPEVLAIWEQMEKLCAGRDRLPAMEFPHFEPVSGR
jgi:hypothetical protein